MRYAACRATCLLLLCALGAFGVTPRFWENLSQEELLEGTLTRVSLAWDGRLSLAPSYDLVYDTGQPFIFAMTRDRSGNVYLGTGHNGKVFKVDPQGKGSLYFQAKELDVFALAVDSAGVLYAGTSPDGRVYRVTAPEKATEFCNPEDKYIWSLALDERGNLFVGTGGRGLILKVNPQGEKSTFYDPGDSNVMSLLSVSDGMLIAGTSPGGMVLRIDEKGKAFTLLDTAMDEIRSLASDRFQTIYAVAASARGPAAPPAGKTDIPDIPPGGALPIATIQVLSSIGERSRDSKSTSAPGGEADSAGARSAIYAIARSGAAETVYTSKDQMVYEVIVASDDSILASTGQRGRILSINPEKQVTVVTDSPEEQITRLLKEGGDTWAAGSNQGRLYRLGAQPALSGSYESKSLDAKAVSAWGRIAWRFPPEAGETCEFRTRSGNTEKPDNTWSEWSGPYVTPGGQQIASPGARYLQWKVDMKRGGNTAAASVPACVDKVSLSYQQQNLRPQVVSITVLSPGIALQPAPPLSAGTVSYSLSSAPREGPALNSPRARGRDDQKMPPRQILQPGAQSFTWKATDDNADELEYSIYFKGSDEKDWKLLEKNVGDTFFTLDGGSLPDGAYLLKVVAGDAPSNEFGKGLIGELVSKPFVISNSTPWIEVAAQKAEGKKQRIEFRAKVPAGRIESAEFSIDGGEWFLVFPKDGIADSTEELYEILTPELGTGEHLIGLRATDVTGSTGTAKLVVRLP